MGAELEEQEAAAAEQRQVSPELLAAIEAAAGAFEGAEFEGLQQGSVPSLAGAAQQQLEFGTGQTVDPRFQQLRTAQTGALEASQRQQRESQSQFLTRRGIGGSAALNEQRRLEESLGTQRQQLAGQLGMQEFQAQQTALQQASGLATAEQQRQLGGIESRNLATQARLQAIAAGVETLSLPDQLRIAALAAQNAGTVQTSGGGGGLFGK